MKKIKKIIKDLNKKTVKFCNIKKPKFKISLELKSSTVLGYYRRTGKKNFLVFNEFLYRSIGVKKYKHVIVHEYAHMITREIYGYKVQSHGIEWKRIMRLLGETNPRSKTSIFNGIQRKESDIKVKCKCSKSYISSNRATRIKNGTTYRCSKCGGKLKIFTKSRKVA